jgi:hypothetical protein
MMVVVKKGVDERYSIYLCKRLEEEDVGKR